MRGVYLEKGGSSSRYLPVVDDDIFVYMGGDQQVPDGVRHARIHKSVKIVRARAFSNCGHLISVEFHRGIEIIIEEYAFYRCPLRSVKLLGVKIIKAYAFCECPLTDVEFGDKLETIEKEAFACSNSTYRNALKTKIKMPSVRTIRESAFAWCTEITDVEFGEGLRTLKEDAFKFCRKLKRIALPLKDDMIGDWVFYQCLKLETVDLVGEIHNTVASLHMESWRIKMNKEVNRINQTLPTTNDRLQTNVIQHWMRSVIRRLDGYKAEHKAILKEATTLLELALWKANLDDNKRGKGEREKVRTTRGSRKRAREDSSVTSGAAVVIKNVLPFLQLSE